MSNLNINLFEQVAVRGQQDLAIAHSGILSGMVSAASGATPILAGDAVKLDPAVTVVGQPQFLKAVAADASAVAIGYAIMDPKSSSVLTPGQIQVALRFHGPVLWLTAAATIAPGAQVEQVNAGGDVQTLAAGTLRGIALDPGTVGNLMRVILA